ncbi:cupin domain-containing protein [Schaalia sp. 19OD2882]|uniref:cupin domain-containing protein n=1 Tax=Schaalia sp. 19OD2882 TaxID=2794089 RepID=UPI001C1EB951|nr:cupin domain-containing protein [Schaalia sp. 19OD2882]QWW19603.1 cupin domain-containing protein [Schaalia sp. 19OD2882]
MSATPSEAAAALVTRLGLEAHPEGGWFRRTWTAPTGVSTPRGQRATASAILFLLDEGEEAVWHFVHSDELWLWHGPGDLEVHLGGSGPEPVEDPAPTLLRGDEDGVVQILVPAGTWQRTFARADVALATCVVSPEFSYEDWELASEGQ